METEGPSIRHRRLLLRRAPRRRDDLEAALDIGEPLRVLQGGAQRLGGARGAGGGDGVLDGLQRGAAALLESDDGLWIYEGAMSFVTTMCYPIGILHSNENWRRIMTEYPRLNRPRSRRAPVIEEGGPSLVDCMAVVWWLYGGCMVVLKVEPCRAPRE